MKDIDVTVVFTQNGEHLSPWETTLSNVTVANMAEAACNSDLVDKTSDIEFIVYDDRVEDNDSPVLMMGKLTTDLLFGDVLGEPSP